MSETKKTKVNSIPLEAEVTIKVSGSFYGRILGSYMCLIGKFEQEYTLELLKVIKEDSFKDQEEQVQLDATAIETLLVLLKGIEMQFKNENKIVQEEVETPISD